MTLMPLRQEEKSLISGNYSDRYINILRLKIFSLQALQSTMGYGYTLSTRSIFKG
jgi:hypothetical protein